MICEVRTNQQSNKKSLINYRRNLQWKFKFKWNEMVKKRFNKNFSITRKTLYINTPIFNFSLNGAAT